jgi:hypothetical protein
VPYFYNFFFSVFMITITREKPLSATSVVDIVLLPGFQKGRDIKAA